MRLFPSGGYSLVMICEVNVILRYLNAACDWIAKHVKLGSLYDEWISNPP